MGVHLHTTFATYAPGITLDDILEESEFVMGEAVTWAPERPLRRCCNTPDAAETAMRWIYVW